MVTLILPAQVKKNAIFLTLQNFLELHPELPTHVRICFGSLNFIRSPGVAFLSNFITWLKQNGVTVTFRNANIQSPPIKYMDDALFFEQHFGQKLDPSSTCRSTTFPVKQIAHQNSHAWLEHEFIPWLMNQSGLNRSSLAEVKTSLQELINNIKDHTEFDQGCIFGQWYPNEQRIIITLADFGQGIPATVRGIEPNLNDNQAIVKAVEDGFSARSLPTNRGAGLHLLLLNIVQRFDGKVTIRSLSGLVEFAKGDNTFYSIQRTNVGFCIGTTIDLVIRTDQIPHAEEEEEDFEW